MGGVTNLGQHLERLRGERVAGLFDTAQSPYVVRTLQRFGRLRGSPEASGFHACDPDLEGELIRALGVDAVEAVIAAAGETASLRILRRQPVQRDWTAERTLHRFLGVRSGRKARYAPLLVAALPPDRVPLPLAAVLDAAIAEGQPGSAAR